MDTYSTTLTDYNFEFNNLGDKIVCYLNYNGIIWQSIISDDVLKSGIIKPNQLMNIIKSNLKKLQPNYNIWIEYCKNSTTNINFIILNIHYLNEFIEFEEKIYFKQKNTLDEAKENNLNQIILNQQKQINELEKKINELSFRPIMAINYIFLHEKMHNNNFQDLENKIKLNNKIIVNNSNDIINLNKYFNSLDCLKNKNNLQIFKQNKEQPIQIIKFIQSDVEKIEINFYGLNYSDYMRNSFCWWFFKFALKSMKNDLFEQYIFNHPIDLSMLENKLKIYENYKFEETFDIFIETHYFLKYIKVKKLVINCDGDDFNENHSTFLIKFIKENFHSNVFEHIEIHNSNLVLNNFIEFTNCKKISIPYNKEFNDDKLKEHCKKNAIQFDYLK